MPQINLFAAFCPKSALAAGIGVNIDIGRNLLWFGSKLGFLNNRTDQTGPRYNNALVIDGTA